MQMVKIKFQLPEQDARGALELAKRFTVICLPEDTYEVPAAALAVLDKSDTPGEAGGLMSRAASKAVASCYGSF